MPDFKEKIGLWQGFFLLTLIALLLRCLNLNDFFTLDEGFHWVWRVQHFTDALHTKNWAGTNLTGHPGITTLWLGALGRWLALAAGLHGPGFADGQSAYLAWLRLPLAIFNSLTISLGYLVLRQLLQPKTAFFAALLWALSPFLIAHSRLLHVDALLTSFMTLSLLFLLWAIKKEKENPFLLLGSGGLAGLAFLTKAPSLLLLPTAGLILLLAAPLKPFKTQFLTLFRRYLIWLSCAIAVIFAVWPAMWVQPTIAFERVINEIVANGGRSHESGNFFWGNPVADPGLFFYLAVIGWRISPITFLGLLFLPFTLRQKTNEQRTLLILSGFVLFFMLLMSLPPKKFDRYLLPIWPALEILAAAGLLSVCSLFPRLKAHLIIGLASSFLFLTNLWYHSYYLAYFNPLLGGSKIAQNVLLVGWGEGMEDVGTWLQKRPDVTRSPVLAWDPGTLEPFVPGRVLFFNAETLKKPASYVVLYARSNQRKESYEAQMLVRQAPPLYTVRKYGLDYAQVYQPPKPFGEKSDARFGNGLYLRGFSQKQFQQTLTLTPSWAIQADQPGGIFCFIHLLANDGTILAQLDAPLDEGLFAQWQAGQQFGSPLPLILPPALPPGSYFVGLGLSKPATGERLPLTQGKALPPELDGPNVLHLTTIMVKK